MKIINILTVLLCVGVAVELVSCGGSGGDADNGGDIVVPAKTVDFSAFIYDDDPIYGYVAGDRKGYRSVAFVDIAHARDWYDSVPVLVQVVENGVVTLNVVLNISPVSPSDPTYYFHGVWEFADSDFTTNVREFSLTIDPDGLMGDGNLENNSIRVGVFHLSSGTG